MPWENKVVIRVQSPGVSFTDDGDIRSKGAGSIFVGISFRGTINKAVIYSAPLENRVSFRRSAIYVDTISFFLQFLEQMRELIFVDIHAILKILLRFVGVELKVELFLMDVFNVLQKLIFLVSEIIGMCCEATDAPAVDVVE